MEPYLHVSCMNVHGSEYVGEAPYHLYKEMSFKRRQKLDEKYSERRRTLEFSQFRFDPNFRIQYPGPATLKFNNLVADDTSLTLSKMKVPSRDIVQARSLAPPFGKTIYVEPESKGRSFSDLLKKYDLPEDAGPPKILSPKQYLEHLKKGILRFENAILEMDKRILLQFQTRHPELPPLNVESTPPSATIFSSINTAVRDASGLAKSVSNALKAMFVPSSSPDIQSDLVVDDPNDLPEVDEDLDDLSVIRKKLDGITNNPLYEQIYNDPHFDSQFVTTTSMEDRLFQNKLLENNAALDGYLATQLGATIPEAVLAVVKRNGKINTYLELVVEVSSKFVDVYDRLKFLNLLGIVDSRGLFSVLTRENVKAAFEEEFKRPETPRMPVFTYSDSSRIKRPNITPAFQSKVKAFVSIHTETPTKARPISVPPPSSTPVPPHYAELYNKLIREKMFNITDKNIADILNNPTFRNEDESIIRFVIQSFQENLSRKAPVSSDSSGPSPRKFGNFITPAGLQNLGNTCYMNSILQCLIATVQLRDLVTDQSFVRDMVTMNKAFSYSKYKGELLLAFNALFEAYKMAPSYVSPDKLRGTFVSKNNQFNNFLQQDANEFLTSFLDGLEGDTLVSNKISVKLPVWDSQNSKESYENKVINFVSSNSVSPLRTMFQGIQMSKLIQGGETSYKAQLFSSLELPIPILLRQLTLDDCLNKYLESEERTELLGMEMVTYRKQYSLLTLPNILVVSLNRFELNETRTTFKKIQTDVQFNKTWNIQGNIYELYAYSLHHGQSMSGGHYTAKVKYGDTWYMADDSSTRRLDAGAPANEDFKDMYILFYKKQNSFTSSSSSSSSSSSAYSASSSSSLRSTSRR